MKKTLVFFCVFLLFACVSNFPAHAATTSAATRFSIFKNDIVKYYDNMHKEKILVVGPKDFLKSFRDAVNKDPKYTYVCSAAKLNLCNYDLIIDAVNNEISFPSLYQGYPKQYLSSFISVYTEILYNKTLEFFRKNNISFYYVEYNWNMVNYLDNYELDVLSGKISPTSIDHVNKLYYDNQESAQYMLAGAEYGKYDITNNGRHNVPVDRKGKYCNVINGKRLTTDSPSKFTNTVHIFGPCGTYCPAVTDKYTITSYLQRLINTSMPNRFISVDNCGVPGSDTLNDFEYMLNEYYHPGDVVIDFSIIFNRQDLLKNAMKKYDFQYVTPRTLFDKPHNYGYVIVDSGGHKNHRANEVFAKYFFSLIKKVLNKNVDKTSYIKYSSDYDKEIFLNNNPELKKYLDSLKEINTTTHSTYNTHSKSGAIVMNCNPFTLGHRYLIEQASNKVDKLYIFVVEEDKSIFPFKDRFDLVKKGTDDLKNVTVLPSGKYMISMLTLPGYFTKDSKTFDTLDASKDLNLFAQYIAPTLGITVRFAGTEPIDKFTCAYNESMKRELPKFGIEFCEIERKTIDNNFISASKVRQLLKEQKFDELKKYVPKITYDYLLQHIEDFSKVA